MMKTLTERQKSMLLNKAYFDPSHEVGFSSPQGLYKYFKSKGQSIGLQFIKDFLMKQDSYTLHRRRVNKFIRRKTVTAKPGLQIQIDLLDLTGLKRFNNGYKFLLTAIDTFSRKVAISPIKSKKTSEVLLAFKSIMKRMKEWNKLKYVQSDKGTEFCSRLFQKYLTEKNIKHFSTSTETKASMIERFHRTLLQRVYKYFTAKSTLNYISNLQNFVKAYNNRVHRSIGRSPNSVNRKNQNDVYIKLYGYIPKRGKPKFKTNDLVRISKTDKTFSKGYLPKWTKEKFVVIKVMDTYPWTYRIRSDDSGEEITGSFYQEELQRVS